LVLTVDDTELLESGCSFKFILLLYRVGVGWTKPVKRQVKCTDTTLIKKFFLCNGILRYNRGTWAGTLLHPARIFLRWNSQWRIPDFNLLGITWIVYTWMGWSLPVSPKLSPPCDNPSAMKSNTSTSWSPAPMWPFAAKPHVVIIGVLLP
jgi:hypothetical protein